MSVGRVRRQSGRDRHASIRMRMRSGLEDDAECRAATINLVLVVRQINVARAREPTHTVTTQLRSCLCSERVVLENPQTAVNCRGAHVAIVTTTRIDLTPPDASTLTLLTA